jgi:hypothetical protein
VKFRRTGKTYTPNGPRECARRVRQAAQVERRRTERRREMIETCSELDAITCCWRDGVRVPYSSLVIDPLQRIGGTLTALVYDRATTTLRRATEAFGEQPAGWSDVLEGKIRKP